MSIVSCRNEDVGSSELSGTTISYLDPITGEGNGVEQLKFTALTGQTEIPLEEAQNIALFTASQMRKIEGITTKAPLKVKSVEIISKGSKTPYLPTKGDKKKGMQIYIYLILKIIKVMY